MNDKAKDKEVNEESEQMDNKFKDKKTKKKKAKKIKKGNLSKRLSGSSNLYDKVLSLVAKYKDIFFVLKLSSESAITQNASQSDPVFFYFFTIFFVNI